MSGIMTEKAFNPRSYKRSDNYDNNILDSRIAFNPRSYKRSDLTIYEKQLQVAFLSIHAPTRGATAKMHNIPYASLQ